MLILDKRTSMVFDDYTVKDSEDSILPYWTQVCSSCSENFTGECLDDAGQGICGVVGCNNESSYYYDFNASPCDVKDSTIKLIIMLKMWVEFGNIHLVDGEIDAPFLHFEKGTSVEDVYAWFEAEHEFISVGQLMNGVDVSNNGDKETLSSFIRLYCPHREKLGSQTIMRGAINGWDRLYIPKSFDELQGIDFRDDERAWVSVGCLTMITYHHGSVNVTIYKSVEELIHSLQVALMFYEKFES